MRADRFIVPRYTSSWDDEQWMILLSPNECKNPLCFLPRSPELRSTDLDIIRRGSADALDNKITLLGARSVSLGESINWNQDYKTGDQWPQGYSKFIDYMNKGRPSDVKTVWELSRMQWLIPCGQEFAVTKDKRLAEFVKKTILHWDENNPFANSVNWSCTMEPAMRVFTLLWFRHVFADCDVWSEQSFSLKLDQMLYQHGWYVDRFFEMSDVNGNHCTADAAALVMVGLYFRHADYGKAWLDRGWRILQDEIVRQVSEDGVDFEASIPYHRLCAELFFIPALCLEKSGTSIPRSYKERVVSMAGFIKHYMRSDLSSPLLGDADDARTLPFGSQALANHHYIADLIRISWGDSNAYHFSSASELTWWLGDFSCYKPVKTKDERASKFFRDGEAGYAVLQRSGAEVFFDAAPIGLSGRGGHGHNDCLHVDVVINGQAILTDSGSYVYTSDYELRNEYRKTHMHNTPFIEGEEINRFIGPDFLWNMHYDAQPKIIEFSPGEHRICANHNGYRRLGLAEIQRNVSISDDGTVTIEDTLPKSSKPFMCYLSLMPEAMIGLQEASRVHIGFPSGALFQFEFLGWALDQISETAIATSYGVRQESQRIALRNIGWQSENIITISRVVAS